MCAAVARPTQLSSSTPGPSSPPRTGQASPYLPITGTLFPVFLLVAHFVSMQKPRQRQIPMVSVLKLLCTFGPTPTPGVKRPQAGRRWRAGVQALSSPVVPQEVFHSSIHRTVDKTQRPHRAQSRHWLASKLAPGSLAAVCLSCHHLLTMVGPGWASRASGPGAVHRTPHTCVWEHVLLHGFALLLI